MTHIEPPVGCRGLRSNRGEVFSRRLIVGEPVLPPNWFLVRIKPLQFWGSVKHWRIKYNERKMLNWEENSSLHRNQRINEETQLSSKPNSVIKNNKSIVMIKMVKNDFCDRKCNIFKINSNHSLQTSRRTWNSSERMIMILILIFVSLTIIARSIKQL